MGAWGSGIFENDGAADWLQGASGRDWFFFAGSDTLVGNTKQSFLNDTDVLPTAHGKPGNGKK